MPRISVGIVMRTSFYPGHEESEEKIWEDDEFEKIEKNEAFIWEKNELSRDKC